MIRLPASRLSIRVSLPLLLSLLVIITVAAVSIVSYVRARAAIRTLVSEDLAQIHERISERLTDVFLIPMRISRINASLIRQDRLNRNAIRLWRDVLFEQVHTFDTVSSIVWGDAQGNMTFISRYPERPGYTYGIRDAETGPATLEYELDESGHTSDTPVIQYNIDPRTRPWYVAARDAPGPIWADIYLWVMKQGVRPVLSVPYVAPVRDPEGRLLGVLDVEFSLYDLSRFLQSLSIGDRGLAYIVDSRGEIVASSTQMPIFDMQSGKRMRAMDAPEPLIAASARLFMDDRTMKIPIQNHMSRTFTTAQGEVLVIASPFQNAGVLKWLIVTVVPVEDFLGEIRQGRLQTILIGAGIVALAVILGIVIARYLARPIVSLADHVRRIGRGDLDGEIALNEFPEFIRLSAAINKMTDGLRDRLKLRESLAMAMEVQQNLLPSATPAVAGLEIAGHSAYCDETGGDYYDFLDMSNMPADTAVIAIGDVSGHGIAAAMVMASARGILRSRCRDVDSLSGILSHMNQHIVADITGGRFMTMLIVAVNAARHELRWSAAGHRVPLIYDPRRDHFHEPEGGDAPLGVTSETVYHEHAQVGLDAGCIVFLATDGLWEAPGASGEAFGMHRVQALIRAHAHEGADVLRMRIVEAVESFRAGMLQHDDLTFVVVRLAG